MKREVAGGAPAVAGMFRKLWKLSAIPQLVSAPLKP